MKILVNGTIAVKDLPILMRSVRLCPTEAEVQDMTGAFKNDKIDFHEFLVSVSVSWPQSRPQNASVLNKFLFYCDF